MPMSQTGPARRSPFLSGAVGPQFSVHFTLGIQVHLEGRATNPHHCGGSCYLVILWVALADLSCHGTQRTLPRVLVRDDRLELAARAQVLRERINTKHLLAGVSLLDPASTLKDDGVNTCVNDRAKKWEFPKTRDGESMTLPYSFNLS